MSTRDAIVGAARDLLWERGYEATSPRMLMDRSGAGQGSLYHHFPSKKSWARTALDEGEAELVRQLDGTLGDPRRTPLERVRAWLEAPRDALRGCRVGRHAFERSVVDDPELREPVARYFEVLEERLRSVLAEAIEGGELPPEPGAPRLAALLIAVVQGGYVLARALRDPRKLEEAARAAADLLPRASGAGR